jgi:hypothetical protein
VHMYSPRETIPGGHGCRERFSGAVQSSSRLVVPDPGGGATIDDGCILLPLRIRRTAEMYMMRPTWSVSMYSVDLKE